MRIVTVYSTSGKTNVKIESGASTFGELTPQLRENGFNLDGMKAVVGETKVTLEADGAVLPEGEFKLFLMPLKTKSGADMSRTDVYNKIKEFIARDGDKASTHFLQLGQYTRVKTVELINLIEQYEGSSRTAPAATATTSAAPATAQTVTLVSKEEFEALLEKLLDIDESDLTSDEADNLIDARSLVDGFIDRFDDANVSSVSVNTTTATPAPRVKTQEEIEREEREQREREEKQALANEANDLMSEFNDVRR